MGKFACNFQLLQIGLVSISNLFSFTPSDLYQKLEFDKIREILSQYCYGEEAQQHCLSIEPVIQITQIHRELAECANGLAALTENELFPMTRYEVVDDELKFLSIDGSVLTEDGIMKIHRILNLTGKLHRFFSVTRQKKYSHLYDIIRKMPYDPDLGKAIDKVLDEEGMIKADASETLLKIRRKKQSLSVELDKVFRKLIAEYRKKGYLKDSVESIRNGRRVFAFSSEHKRKIKGIIHDESTTGKTAFIEPVPVLEINNDLFDLVTEEKKEIYRILKELSAVLRPYVDQIRQAQQILVELDVVQAKVRLGASYDGVSPKVMDKPHIGWKRAFHPLLFLKNKTDNKKTVPFNLEMFGANRILVLSGPNAGGKSITMKSVGLLQLMIQAGIPVPVDEKSEVGIFKNICADIGDQQSIEDDLSTYSSRLKNMREFLELSGKETLVLIDEFGSGTDPKIGGAIAESILNALHRKRIFGFITTHYPNLKIFAFKTRGIVNASMTFDKENLSPNYELKVGTPGSSYAFEIAQKSGLGPEIMKYAKKRVGANEKAVDKLLVDLQRESQELKEKLEKVASQEKQLKRLIGTYEGLFKELEHRRKKIKLDAKEQSLQQASRDNRVFEKLVREIKETKNLEKAKELAAQVRTDKEDLNKKVEELREEVYYKPTAKDADKPLEVGDFVKLRTGGSTGKLEAIKGNKAIVVMGLMKMTANLRDLIPANTPLEINSKKGVTTDMETSSATFESKIDLRGLRKDEAIRLLESFVDKALISSATHIRIVHGKGDGVLRKAVKQKLREYKSLGHVFHPERMDGGDGVTVVDMTA